MRISSAKFCVLVAAVLVCTTVLAQQPEGRGRGRGRGPGGPGGPGGMPAFPLLQALDADNDGEVSAEEIENAVAALKGLDKNKDGKLTRDEMMPQFGGRGFGRGGAGGAGGGRGFGRGGPGGAGGAGGAQNFVANIMAMDKNNDGKVTAEEIGDERRAGFILRGDTDNDGAVSKAELEKMVEQFGAGRGRGRGGEGGRGGRGRGRGPGNDN